MIKFLKKLKEALNKEDTQTVYRYVSSVELRRIQNADTQHLGVYFDNLKLSNHHKYLPNVKYMHFFDTYNHPPHILNSLSPYSRYLCAFEISKSILKKYQGIGIYVGQGYKHDYSYVTEYAIPVSEYKPSMFVGAVKYRRNLQFGNTPLNFNKDLCDENETTLINYEQNSVLNEEDQTIETAQAQTSNLAVQFDILKTEPSQAEQPTNKKLLSVPNQCTTDEAPQPSLSQVSFEQ